MLEVARILRPHGLQGEVVVEAVSNRSGRLVPGASFSLGSSTAGSAVGSTAGPLSAEGSWVTVSAARPMPTSRHAPYERWLVRFAAVESREAAEALQGRALLATPLEEPGTLWVHELIGATVETVEGHVVGQVSAVEANPASDLLVLDGGGLIPLRFVVDAFGGRVRVEIPDGLLDD